MQFAAPYRAFWTGADGDVLSALAGTTRPLTGREVARVAERSEPGVRPILRRLVEHGVVDAQEAGRAVLYSLNRNHVAFPAIELLMNLRAVFVERTAQAIAAWEVPPVHASLFGSAARAEARTDSDIDVFIVRSSVVDEDNFTWRGQLDVLAKSVATWSGNHAAIAEVSETDLRGLWKERLAVVAQLITQAVTLYGPPAKALLQKTPDGAG